MDDKLEVNQKHLKDFVNSGLTKETLIKACYKSIEGQVVDNGLTPTGRKKVKVISGYWQVPIICPFTKKKHYHRKKLDQPIVDPKTKKETYYISPANSVPHLYFSQQLNWDNVLPCDSIVLTEGEKKADKYIQDTGKPAVALSGVWCFRTASGIIGDLKLLCQKVKTIDIVFDSDYKDKPIVQQAKDELMNEIELLGCIPIDCSLPGPEKGLDDFLITSGKEALEEHLCICREATNLDRAKKKEQENLINQKVLEYLSGDVIRDNFLPLTEGLLVQKEEELKVLSYLCANSRLTNAINGALHCRVIGDSGMGKSKVVEFVGENFIGEDFIERASFTIASIYRRGKDFFKHKVLFTSEVPAQTESQEEINALLRTLKTKGRASRDVATKQGEDIITITLEAEGPTSFPGTTTRTGGRDEDLNRDIIANPDGSKEQTIRIQQSKTAQKVKYNPEIAKRVESNLQVQNAVQKLLKRFIPTFIEVPYAPYIVLPAKGGAARRDTDKILRLIETCCHLNILNRDIRILNCADRINEFNEYIKSITKLRHHGGSGSKMVEGKKIENGSNAEISPNSNEYQTIDFFCTSLESDILLGYHHDPFVKYCMLQKFIKEENLEFVLISDIRDFEVVKEYCSDALEAPYQQLSGELIGQYKQILQEIDNLPRNQADSGSVGSWCTANEAAEIIDRTPNWTLEQLNKLVRGGYVTKDEKTKPHKFNFTKSKLAESHDKAKISQNWKLNVFFPEHVFIPQPPSWLNHVKSYKNVQKLQENGRIQQSVDTPKKPPPSLIKKEASNDDS